MKKFIGTVICLVIFKYGYSQSNFSAQKESHLTNLIFNWVCGNSVLIPNQEDMEKTLLKKPTSSNLLFAFPNPAHSYTNVNLPVTLSENVKIKLTHISGMSQELDYHIINENLIKIDLSSITPGIYLITFNFNGNKEFKSAKLIVE